MRFSEDKISHLSHRVWDDLYDRDLVDYDDDQKVLELIKKALVEYFKVDDEIDQKVRQKVSSLKRGVFEGTSEWEVLYKKYYEEEMVRKNF